VDAEVPHFMGSTGHPAQGAAEMKKLHVQANIMPATENTIMRDHQKCHNDDNKDRILYDVICLQHLQVKIEKSSGFCIRLPSFKTGQNNPVKMSFNKKVD
jgi:hypothetical protein